MLTKPKASHLRAAVTLTGLTLWRDFESLIDSEIAGILDLIVESRDMAVLHQLQGRARALKELKQLIVDSPTLLEKVERPSGGTRGY